MSIYFKQDKVETSLKGYEVRFVALEQICLDYLLILIISVQRDDSEDVWDTDP